MAKDANDFARDFGDDGLRDRIDESLSGKKRDKAPGLHVVRARSFRR